MCSFLVDLETVFPYLNNIYASGQGVEVEGDRVALLGDGDVLACTSQVEDSHGGSGCGMHAEQATGQGGACGLGRGDG